MRAAVAACSLHRVLQVEDATDYRLHEAGRLPTIRRRSFLALRRVDFVGAVAVICSVIQDVS